MPDDSSNGSGARFARLCIMESVFQAQHAESMLREAGIEPMVVSFHDTAMDGLYQAHKGWGEIRVREPDLERAQALLERRLTNLHVPDEELEREAMDASPAEPAPDQAEGATSRPALLPLLLMCVAVLGGVVAIRQMRAKPEWLPSLTDFQWAVTGVLVVQSLLIAYLLWTTGRPRR